MGSESKFAKPPACPEGAVRRTEAKLASDPNNHCTEAKLASDPNNRCTEAKLASDPNNRKPSSFHAQSQRRATDQKFKHQPRVVRVLDGASGSGQLFGPLRQRLHAGCA